MEPKMSHATHGATTRAESPPRYRWWHAAAVGAAANAVTAASAGFSGDQAYYNSLWKPAVAPPDWAFPPVWAFNNATTLWSNLRVANLPRGTPGRRAALALEAAGWGSFTVFPGLYFGLRSPVLAAADTALYLAMTTASVVVTSRLDRKAAWALVPRLAWLALATYVSTSMALRNRDDFLGGEPDAPER
jgi:tryptophan-rich sensory protein